MATETKNSFLITNPTYWLVAYHSGTSWVLARDMGATMQVLGARQGAFDPNKNVRIAISSPSRNTRKATLYVNNWAAVAATFKA
jgi:hypothetical protein